MLAWGFVQAGGRSSRMGTDKAWIEDAGQVMIQRVFNAVRPAVDQIGIIINPANPNLARYQSLAVLYGAELFFDRQDYVGPLGGIETALRVCAPQTSVLIVACDLPFVTPEFFTLLSQVHRLGANDLTLPIDVEGRAQPLAAVYSAACLPVVEALLRKEVRRVDRLYDLIQTRRIPFAEYQHLPNAAELLRNLNRPEDIPGANG